MKKTVYSILCAMMLLLLLVGCAGTNIVGKWSASGLEYKGQLYTAEEIEHLSPDDPRSAYAGWMDASLYFSGSGAVVLRRPGDFPRQMEEVGGLYAVGEGFVELFGPDAPENVMLLPLEDGQMRFGLSDDAVVLFRK